jgi:hypothetical protein
VDPKTKAQLEKLSPEKRAKAEALIARHATPEYRAKEAAARERLDAEMAETGTIATDGPEPLLVAVGRSLRERRRADNDNPTVSTLNRVAAALGTQITIGVEAVSQAEHS